MNEVLAVTEVFKSFQGEGLNIGKPAVFVRFYGCNNNCTFCDSKYSTKMEEAAYRNVDIKKMTYDELTKEILEFGVDHVVFTGGEPLLQKDFLEEFEHNYLYKMKIEIETNGTIVLPDFKNTLFNVSPKLLNSGNIQTEEYINNLVANVATSLMKGLDICLKFVVDCTYFNLGHDIHEIEDFVNKVKIFREKNYDRWFNSLYPIYLMPMGTDEQTIKNGIHILSMNSRAIQFPFTISPRLHVLVYGSKMGV
jgi:organic radical activating enzyme